jgi:membrane protein
LIASLAWKTVIAGFSWYLGSRFGQYQLVYGSLGAIVAFLFLMYIISMITLFGAHLSAAIEGWESDRLSAAT